MNKEQIPQAVIDSVEGMFNPLYNDHVKQNFEDRVVSIVQFCNESLKQRKFKKTPQWYVNNRQKDPTYVMVEKTNKILENEYRK